MAKLAAGCCLDGMDEVAQNMGDEARLTRIAGAVEELRAGFPAPGLRV